MAYLFKRVTLVIVTSELLGVCDLWQTRKEIRLCTSLLYRDNLMSLKFYLSTGHLLMHARRQVLLHVHASAAYGNSVSPSVCLSHLQAVSKRQLIIGLFSPSCYYSFCYTKRGGKILMAPLSTGTLNI